MEKLREQRAEADAAALDPADQPTVESEALVLPPEAATPMAAAYSHHPAFAVEVEDVGSELPPLAEALARAAESEREAAEEVEPAAGRPPPTSQLSKPPQSVSRRPQPTGRLRHLLPPARWRSRAGGLRAAAC